jgi:hypothetical protein
VTSRDADLLSDIYCTFRLVKLPHTAQTRCGCPTEGPL